MSKYPVSPRKKVCTFSCYLTPTFAQHLPSCRQERKSPAEDLPKQFRFRFGCAATRPLSMNTNSEDWRARVTPAVRASVVSTLYEQSCFTRNSLLFSLKRVPDHIQETWEVRVCPVKHLIRANLQVKAQQQEQLVFETAKSLDEYNAGIKGICDQINNSRAIGREPELYFFNNHQLKQPSAI